MKSKSPSAFCIRVFWITTYICLTSTLGQIKHKFVAVDNGNNLLVMVDQINETEWITEVPGGARDISLMESGKLLVSHDNGAAEYSLETGEKLDWALDSYSGVNSARPLENGNILLGFQNGRLIEVDRDKNVISDVRAQGINDVRLIRVQRNGNVLMTGVEPFRVFEVTRSGAVVWSAPLPGKGYVAFRLANGNVLATTGETATAVEINPSGDIVSETGGDNRHDSLLWFSGMDTLANGNIVVANWNGHGMEGQGPHIVEFDRDNNLVWKWNDPQRFRTITNILILDNSKDGVRPGCPDSAYIEFDPERTLDDLSLCNTLGMDGSKDLRNQSTIEYSGKNLIVMIPVYHPLEITLTAVNGLHRINHKTGADGMDAMENHPRSGQVISLPTDRLPTGLYFLSVKKTGKHQDQGKGDLLLSRNIFIH